MEEFMFNARQLKVAQDAADRIGTAERQAFTVTLDAYLAAGAAFKPLADAGATQRQIEAALMVSQRKVSQAIALHTLRASDPTEFKALVKAHTGSLASFVKAHITDGGSSGSSTPTKVTVKVVREQAHKDVARLRKSWTPAQVRAYAEAILAELG